MKHTLLIAAFALAASANAQFTSGLENWTDTVPSDWMGSKTTLSADSVEQVSTNPHGGSYAVRLQNTSSGHKRFTTQPTTVVDGTTYDVTYWVRGSGSIRTGLFDGRSSGSGFASYTPYFVSTGNTWTQVTQQITAANDTTAAEFILSILSTSGPEHLVVDDVNISGGIINPPVDASVYQIQYTTDVSGNSPLVNQAVNTGGIVTGVDTIGTNSYFIQSGTGPWSGIYVFDATSVVNIGDSVTMQAMVAEFQGVTELTDVTNLVVVGQFPVPAPQVLTPVPAADEQWEGVLAKIFGLGCTAAPDQFGQWTGSGWQGAYIVDDLMYAYTPSIGSFYNITGVLHWSFSERKIEPRILSDIETGSGIAEAADLGISAFPNPSSTTLTVNIPGISNGVGFTLNDVTGRTVRSGSFFEQNNVLSVEALAPGVYNLLLSNNGALSTTRVLVQR